MMQKKIIGIKTNNTKNKTTIHYPNSPYKTIQRKKPSSRKHGDTFIPLGLMNSNWLGQRARELCK